MKSGAKKIDHYSLPGEISGAASKSGTSLKVVHIIPAFYPAIRYGGPIFSTKAIVDGLASASGFCVEVLTTNSADPNSKAILALEDNPVLFPEGYKVWYCRTLLGTLFSPQLLGKLMVEVGKSDVVHLTGPYNYPVIPTLLACRITGTPLVWSLRGGFLATEQWSQVPKRRLKRSFESVCAMLRPDRTVFHVTSEDEAEFSTRRFPGVEAALIPNSVEIPLLPFVRSWRKNGQLRLAFLSRIHPKKGLELLIDAVASLPKHVTLDVYGEGDDVYLAAMKHKVAELRLTERVKFLGQVSGDAKANAYIQCDLFVLPTLSENFGIVVAEALAHGTPVLTTRNAPWEGLNSHNCGLQVDASTPALAEAILKLDGMDLQKMGSRGRDWMKRDFSAQSMVDKFAKLYRRVTNPLMPERSVRSVRKRRQ